MKTEYKLLCLTSFKIKISMDSVKQKSAWNEEIFKTTNLVDFAYGVYEMATSLASDGSVGSVVVIYHFHHWFEHVSVETVPSLLRVE